ncbi:hypothetical protein XENOCAPTIV_015596, partial [Xenoophorus captivus]
SFSELYQKAIKDAECKSGEDQSGVAWVDQPTNQIEEVSVSQLTRSFSLEKQLSYTDTDSCDGELRDATPDLILAVKPKVPLEDEQVNHNT